MQAELQMLRNVTGAVYCVISDAIPYTTVSEVSACTSMYSVNVGMSSHALIRPASTGLPAGNNCGREYRKITWTRTVKSTAMRFLPTLLP